MGSYLTLWYLENGAWAVLFFLVLERSVICPFGEYLGRSKIKGLSSCEYSNYSQYSLFLKEIEGKKNLPYIFSDRFISYTHLSLSLLAPHYLLRQLALDPFTVRNSSDLRYS